VCVCTLHSLGLVIGVLRSGEVPCLGPGGLVSRCRPDWTAERRSGWTGRQRDDVFRPQQVTWTVKTESSLQYWTKTSFLYMKTRIVNVKKSICSYIQVQVWMRMSLWWHVLDEISVWCWTYRKEAAAANLKLWAARLHQPIRGWCFEQAAVWKV